MLGVSRLASFNDVEDAAAHATEVLGLRVPALATWGDAAHMAISELCDNAMEHGRATSAPTQRQIGSSIHSRPSGS